MISKLWHLNVSHLSIVMFYQKIYNIPSQCSLQRFNILSWPLVRGYMFIGVCIQRKSQVVIFVNSVKLRFVFKNFKIVKKIKKLIRSNKKKLPFFHALLTCRIVPFSVESSKFNSRNFGAASNAIIKMTSSNTIISQTIGIFRNSLVATQTKSYEPIS